MKNLKGNEMKKLGVSKKIIALLVIITIALISVMIIFSIKSNSNIERNKTIEAASYQIAEENINTDDENNTEDTNEMMDISEFENEAIEEQATEDERSFSSSLTLSKILGGDILTTRTIRHQIWLILLIALFILIYIANGYSCRQDLIQIDKLTQELQDAKFKALSTHSQITEKSRESNVLEMLKDNKDSVLHIADQPPYIINVPDDDQ